MIKLFRNLRKKLAAENRFMAYSRYAIGEIILVVIGILIALQINNWNNHRQNLKKEQEILINLKEEFNQNLNELRRDHKINQECLNACYALLKLDKQGKVDPHIIDSLMGRAFNFATFDARIGVINDLSSSGKLELIRDSELRYRLNQWTGELNDYSEDIIIRRNYWINNANIFNKYIPIRNTDATQDRPDYQRDFKVIPLKVPLENYQKFLNDMEMDSALYNHYLNQSFVSINEEVIEKFLMDVIDILNQNIQ